MTITGIEEEAAKRLYELERDVAWARMQGKIAQAKGEFEEAELEAGQKYKDTVAPRKERTQC